MTRAAYPIQTRVTIDGVEASADPADAYNGIPVVVDDISLQWGRDSVVDQPATGSCTFALREETRRDPTVSILDTLHTGAQVEVWARAGEVPPAGDEVMDSVTFPAVYTLPATMWEQTNPSVTGDMNVVVTSRFGKRAAWIEVPGDYDWASTIVFPPTPYAPAGGAIPDAWDHKPRLLPGQTWQMQMITHLPEGAGVGRLAAKAFTDPHRAATGQLCQVVGPDIPGDGHWHTTTATVQLPADWTDPDGAWIAPGLTLTQMPSQTTWDEMTGIWDDQTFRRWLDLNRAGVARISLTQTASSARNVLVWAGEIATLAVGFASGHAVRAEVTAVDAGAALAKDTIGDTPWPQQTVNARANQIMTMSRSVNDLDLVIDPSLQGFRVAYRDVDNQPVLGLLQDLATTAGGAFWIATHATAGTYLWMEDQQTRAAVRQLIIDPATGTVTIGGNTRSVIQWSAADLVRDDLSISQDVTTVITSVDVTWQHQTGTDPDSGDPVITEETITRTDEDAADQYGLQSMSISTELAYQADAINRADRQLQQARGTEWTLDGLTVDTRCLQRPIPEFDDPTRLNAVMDLLDGTIRLGQAITLIDMPDWLPTGVTTSVYLEGGSYTLTDGRWNLTLTASPAVGAGHSVTWNEVPTDVTWDDFDTSISFNDLYGVAAP